MVQKATHTGELLTQTFGEEFWDLPQEDRFLMVLRKCINVPNHVSEKEFIERAHNVARTMSDFDK